MIYVVSIGESVRSAFPVREEAEAAVLGDAHHYHHFTEYEWRTDPRRDCAVRLFVRNQGSGRWKNVQWRITGLDLSGSDRESS